MATMTPVLSRGTTTCPSSQDPTRPNPQPNIHPNPQPATRSSHLEPTRSSPQQTTRSDRREPTRHSPQPTARSSPREPTRHSPQPTARSSPREPTRYSPQPTARSNPREPTSSSHQPTARSSRREPTRSSPRTIPTDLNGLSQPRALALPEQVIIDRTAGRDWQELHQEFQIQCQKVSRWVLLTNRIQDSTYRKHIQGQILTKFRRTLRCAPHDVGNPSGHESSETRTICKTLRSIEMRRYSESALHVQFDGKWIYKERHGVIVLLEGLGRLVQELPSVAPVDGQVYPDLYWEDIDAAMGSGIPDAVQQIIHWAENLDPSLASAGRQILHEPLVRDEWKGNRAKGFADQHIGHKIHRGSNQGAYRRAAVFSDNEASENAIQQVGHIFSG